MYEEEEMPRGLFEPVWWRNRKWSIVSPAIANGVMKWIAKNRVRVALSTANPPHTHSTNIFPM